MIDINILSSENNSKATIITDLFDIEPINYVVVDDQTENKPHLISALLYSDVNSIDIVCITNGIVDCMNIPQGTVLKVVDGSNYRDSERNIELLPTDINNINVVGGTTSQNSNKPNVKKTTTKNYTKNDNGVFIF